jgi:hypothetical protein
MTLETFPIPAYTILGIATMADVLQAGLHAYVLPGWF